MDSKLFSLWIDNDGCPQKVRDIVFKAAKRVACRVRVVANRYMHPPPGLDVEIITVSSGFDAADDHIADNVAEGDLVITADVPLADRVIAKGAIALSPHGQVFDAATIKEKLAMRNLNQELRSAGEIFGGPSAYGAADVKRFAGALDRILAKVR